MVVEKNTLYCSGVVADGRWQWRRTTCTGTTCYHQHHCHPLLLPLPRITPTTANTATTNVIYRGVLYMKTMQKAALSLPPPSLLTPQPLPSTGAFSNENNAGGRTMTTTYRHYYRHSHHHYPSPPPPITTLPPSRFLAGFRGTVVCRNCSFR